MPAHSRRRQPGQVDVSVRLDRELWQQIEREAANGGISASAQHDAAIRAWLGRNQGDMIVPIGLGSRSLELEASAGTGRLWFLFWSATGNQSSAFPVFSQSTRPFVALGTIRRAPGTSLIVECAPVPDLASRPFVVMIPRSLLLSWHPASENPLEELRELCDPSYGPDPFYIRHLLMRIWPEPEANGPL